MGCREEIADFVCGFFNFLNREGYESAVLHGGQDRFHRVDSDIDFVIECRGFSKIDELIQNYCSTKGWCLVQIFMHENTGAFCVCAKNEEASTVVALDACSDYQRNGSTFLKADEMLKNKRSLSWGGYKVSESIELRYRFSKAAAKCKEAKLFHQELRDYSLQSQGDLKEWLQRVRGISINLFSFQSVKSALSTFYEESKRDTKRINFQTIERVLYRVLCPSGCIVLSRNFKQEELMSITYKNLYFRRVIPDSFLLSTGALHVLKSRLVFNSKWTTIFGLLEYFDIIFDGRVYLNEYDANDAFLIWLKERRKKRTMLGVYRCG